MPRQRQVREPLYFDRIAQAYRREREHGSVQLLPGSFITVMAQDFRCACCARLRAGEDRREPRSEVCIQCVEAAGFPC